MIKIIDYKAGNAPSVKHALDRIGYKADYARSPQELSGATHIILPGVGSAKATIESLREMGLLEALNVAVLDRKVFFLGICVGMQVLFEHSDEGDAECLGWMKGRVVKFDAAKVRVPQMGWNEVRFVRHSPCRAQDDYFYFVNSYYAKPADKADIWGVADYQGIFAASVHKENIYGTQFHAEKSGEAGLRLLGSFLSLGTEGYSC